MIEAADAAGLFYAHATLAQLARLHDGVAARRRGPGLARPARPRGDARHRARQGPDDGRRCSRSSTGSPSWKVNQIQLYSEHTFAYRDHETVWRDASPMTAEEIRAVDEYCTERHIELVPNQNCLGHMGRWLAHDEYRHLAMAPTADQPDRAPDDDRADEPGVARARARACSGELLPNFSHRRFVNVGLDEPWELPPERIDDYLEWVRVLRALPELDGREMLIWSDILAGEPGPPPGAPRRRDGVRVGLRRRSRRSTRGPRPTRRAARRSGPRRARRAGSRSSAGSRTCGRTTSRPSTRRSRTAGAGSSTPTGATTGTSSTCRSASRASRTARRSRGAPTTNRDLDLGAALSTHCYDDPDRRARRDARRARRPVPRHHAEDDQRVHARAPALLAAARRRAVAAEGRAGRRVRGGRGAARRGAATRSPAHARAGRTARSSSTSCATRSRSSRC